jgi:hypothetical protein
VYTSGDVPTLHAEGSLVPQIEQHASPGPRRLLRVELH